MLEIKNVSKSYPSFKLQNINLDLQPGVTALIGLNGAGKTTLIDIILDLIPYEEGEILILGKSSKVAASRGDISYLPAVFNFYPFYSVKNCLTLLAKLKNTDIPQDFVSKFGPLDIMNRKIRVLSTGERQRLGLAACYLGNPKLIIMDEPFSGIDPVFRKDLKDMIMMQKQEVSFLISSHDLLDIQEISDHFVLIHQGKIIEQGKMIDDLEQFFYDKVK